jgi:hypothetical protein
MAVRAVPGIRPDGAGEEPATALSSPLQRLIVGHIVVRLRHKQRPFRDLPRAPEKYWAMFRRSRLKFPAPMFKLGVLRSRGVVIAPPQVRIAAPSAA